MHLYILRHGKAERHATSGRDGEPSLADSGAGPIPVPRWPLPPPRSSRAPALVLSSPAVRADAPLLRSSLGTLALNLKVRHEEALALDTTFKGALSLAEGLLGRPAPALLVGHNPTLSRLIDHVAGADELRTGELSVLELTSLADARELTRFRLDD